ncbi:MAG: alpha/beta fold hydrolase [Bacillota bacterium]|jgi:alpha-beta hydrolase superfamily lysophospholipase|nr:alpha/beta fold hydrolase [Bacillota bacterium]NLL26355.1 alpha/beta hydrolase [Erysipelotrichia bacterium]
MLHEVSFLSHNERDHVKGWIYVPACEPKGILQIVHGFGEHSRRYLHMIVAMMDAGFIVAADDHVGHGKTAVENPGTWGDWGDKGYRTMMEDEYTLTKIVKEMYPKLPYFLYGHSMGSFIARDYITKYGDELAGCILCGTSGPFPGLEESKVRLEKALAEGKGNESGADEIGKLLGWMIERCEETIRFGNEWICHDEYVQYDHAHDPFDAFTKPTLLKSAYDFVLMLEAVGSKEWAKKVPIDLPIYNIAGDQDPVGQYGEGVYQVSNWLIDTGHYVETVLYPGYRHEIHNYDDLKWEVEDGIIEFMEFVLEAEE